MIRLNLLEFNMILLRVYFKQKIKFKTFLVIFVVIQAK